MTSMAVRTGPSSPWYRLCFSAEIFAVTEEGLAAKLDQMRKDGAALVLKKDKELCAGL